MRSIFDKSTRNELVQRINSLTEDHKSVWGRMNVYQMPRHCTLWNEWVLGKKDFVYKQDFLGKIFGKMALNSNTKNDKPIGKNLPAGKAFTVKDKVGDLVALKLLWVE
ncbi:MAG: hypothetical protein EOO46_19080, partial [Flavobacterium sp.]